MASSIKFIVVGPGLLSYVSLKEPTGIGGAKTNRSWSFDLLIKKSDEATVAQLKAAINAAIKDGQDSKVFKTAISKETFQSPLQDGDQKEDQDTVYSGCYYVHCKRNELNKSGEQNQAPSVYTFDKKLVDRADPKFDDIIYSGCTGFARISFYPYDYLGKQGVSAYLGSVMKKDDGQRLGGGDSADDFDALRNKYDSKAKDSLDSKAPADESSFY